MTADSIRTLRYARVAGGRPYHAALLPFGPTWSDRLGPHRHDFHEMFLVTAGSGYHMVRGEPTLLRRGDLMLIRPDDLHEFAYIGEKGMEHINIAFPSHLWRRFTDLAGITAAQTWEQRRKPLLSCDTGEAVQKAFTAALTAFARGVPTPLDVIRLWGTVLPRFESVDGDQHDTRPHWLITACTAMSEEQHLRAGLPRLLELAAVSHGHLARTMCTHYGRTPIEFVTEHRLAHAAALLTATTVPIGVIADRCGFTSQSYFGRQFRQRHGCSPRTYREQGRRAVVPRPAVFTSGPQHQQPK